MLRRGLLRSTLFPVALGLVGVWGKAAVGAVTIEVLTPPRTVSPGEVALHAFALQNETPSTVAVALTAALPAGWTDLGVPSSVVLGPGEDEVVFLAVVVPRGAEAGRYRVGLDASWPGGAASAEGEVRVIPVADVVVVPPVSEQGQPGDAVTYTLEVVNRGNAIDRLFIEVSSARGWPVRTAPRELLLRPLESGRVEVVLTIPPGAPTGRELLSVVVTSEGGAEARATWPTRVLPPGPEAIVGTILSELAMTGGGALGFDLLSGQVRSELSLGGDGEVLGGRVALALRGEGPLGPAPFRLTRGFLRYEGDWVWAEVGETQLTLSSLLTSLGAVGMAGGIWGNPGRVELLTGWIGDEGQWGARGLWTLPWAELGLALRAVTGGTQGGAAWVQVFPVEGWTLGLEAALAGPPLDGAVLLRTSAGEAPQAGLLLEAYAVGPGLPSPRADRMGFTLSGQLSVQPIGVRFNTRWERDNVANAPGPTLARSELTVAADWTPVPLLSLVTGLSLRRTQNVGSGPALDWRTRTVDLGGVLGDSPLLLRLGGRWRWEEDQALSTTVRVEEYSQRLILTLGRTKASLNLTQAVRVPRGGPPELGGGVDLDLRIPGDLTLTARFASGGGALGVGLPVALSPLAAVGFRLDVAWTGQGEVRWLRLGVSFERRFSLTPPFLPARGWLEGRVFVDEDGDDQPDPGEAGVEGAVLSAGGGQVATGRGGRFVFPPLAPGRYALAVESLPEGVRLRVPVPVEVEVVLAGRTTVFLPVERLGEIAGVVFEDLDGGGTQGEGERGLAGVRVVLHGEGREPVDAFTNPLGRFAWPGLPAGAYRVRVDVATLSAAVVLVGAAEQEVLLGPGAVEEVAFRVEPRPVVVVYRPPLADFRWEPALPRVGEEVAFDASVSLGAIVSYAWDFTGDGQADEEGPRPRWTFPSPGFYLVTLTVVDDEGESDRLGILVEVVP